MSKRILLTSLFITLFILLFFAFTSNEVYYAQIEGDVNARLQAQMELYVKSLTEERDGNEAAAEIADIVDGTFVTVFDMSGVVTDSTMEGLTGTSPRLRRYTKSARERQ